MDSDFKVPSLINTKIKFIPRPTTTTTPTEETQTKSSENEQTNSIEKTKINYNSTTTIKEEEKKKEPQPINKSSNKFDGIKSKHSYIEPNWSSKPTEQDDEFFFEVLKNGIICERFNNLQTKSYWLMGKLPSNQIVMAHPTISRCHAVLQYRPNVPIKQNDDEDDDGEAEDANADIDKLKQSTPPPPQIEKGWYLYDLASSHGTFINKMRIPPKTYIRVRVGYMIKFGCSTRTFIFQGPESDAEPESELTVTEIKIKRQEREAAIIEQQKVEEQRKEDEGINWGMGDDADEETDLSINPFASTNNEELFLQDPKKTLRGYFEREGLDLDYRVDEMSPGTFVCRIDLPITDTNGRNLVAEICHKGKKKDCVFQGALEACRMLDRHGVLRQANHESRKRKIDKSDSDDDDDFYDRTGAVERKRLEKITNNQDQALSYQDLLDQEQQLITNLLEIENKIEKYQLLDKAAKKRNEDSEDLDDFMGNLSHEKNIDKIEIRKLRIEVQNIKNDQIKLQKLIRIARPIALPPLQNSESDNMENTNTQLKKSLPLFGKHASYKLPTNKKTAATTSSTNNTTKNQNNDEHSPPQTESSNVTNKKTTEQSNKMIEEIENLNSNDKKIFESIDDEEKMDSELAKQRKAKLLNNNKIEEEEEERVEEADDDKQEIINDGVIAKEDIAEENLNNSAGNKKKRNRVRVRGGRDNVDFNDADELMDMEKYSTWLPPQNQSGDGSTDLNKKFGY